MDGQVGNSSGNSILETMGTHYILANVVIAAIILIVVIVAEYFRDTTALVPHLPKMKRQDFTLDELKKYNGKRRKRILIAVDGYVFDVTKDQNLYGPNGPYESFAGRDASRGLATFNTLNVKIDEYDDLRDFTFDQMDDVREWGIQFRETYDVVGKLIRPWESRNNYTDEQSAPINTQDHEHYQ